MCVHDGIELHLQNGTKYDPICKAHSRMPGHKASTHLGYSTHPSVVTVLSQGAVSGRSRCPPSL